MELEQVITFGYKVGLGHPHKELGKGPTGTGVIGIGDWFTINSDWFGEPSELDNSIGKWEGLTLGENTLTLGMSSCYKRSLEFSL